MKKSKAIASLDPNDKERVAPLQRHHLYYLTMSHSVINVPVLLTHFYSYGIKFKVLINCNISRNGYYHIRYTRLSMYSLKPMHPEDLPLYAHCANEHMSFGITKSLKKEVYHRIYN